MKTVFSAAAVALVMVSSAAFAQNPPITYGTQPYTNLVGGTPVVFNPTGTFSAADEGAAVLPLGFNFSWYGETYDRVVINTNGLLILDKSASPTTACVSTNCYSNQAMPSVATPNAVIAPFWDDYEITSPGGVFYTSTAGDFEVEYKNVESIGLNYTLSFRVKISSSGAVFIHYGPATGTDAFAVMGFENGTGTLGANLIPPPRTTSCGISCDISDIVPNAYITIGQPATADLIVSQVNRTAVTVVSGNNLSIAFNALVQNIGLTPANGWQWKAYLSNNTTLETATDQLIYSSTVATSLAPVSSTTVSATVNATVTTGQYYILVVVDTGLAVTEASETNNVGYTTSYFINGLDLVATSVTGPANSGPGNQMSLNLKWFNQGTTSAGAVSYRVLLSSDATLSSNDFELVAPTSRMVAGGQTIDDTIMVTVPANVPGGDFYYLLQIDPANAVGEAIESNNTVASATTVNIRQADLVNLGGDLKDTVTGVSTHAGYFGQPTRVSLNMQNVGGADARNFHVGVVVSKDLTLSLLGDTKVYDAPIALVGQGTSQTADFTFTMPLNDKDGHPFATGQYYLFFIVDSLSEVTELNEGNNISPLAGAVTLSAPAPDLTVLRIDSPASAGVGEVAPIFRTLKNIGNVASTSVKYRYYASANAIISSDDTLLPIIGANNMPADFGSVTLGAGASDSATDLVQLPVSLAPGSYYLGVIIDQDNEVLEIDETNNALASSQQVQIAASSLKVASTSLPDAVVGRPYSFRLSAQGVQGTATWTIGAADMLPMGISLDSTGLITGTPLSTSVTAFTAIVADGSRQAVARLVMRVLPSTSQVEVTTSALPPIVNSPSVTYDYTLGASGGQKPYAWKLVSGTLPGGGTITLNAATGSIFGAPRSGTAESSTKIVVQVTDASGSTATRELTVRVVAPGSILISANSLTDALVNVDYTVDIGARNSDMSAVSMPLTWRIVSGALPDGLSLSTIQGSAVISGTPLVAGVFSFSIQVEDSKGRSDTADLQLRVYPGRLKVTANNLPTVVRPGDAAGFSFTTGGTATYSLYAGALPPGVTLNTDGTVSGSVADTDDAVGSFSFVIEAVDASNASGLGAFGLEVQREVKKTGCSAAPGTSALWMLLGLVPMVWRKRKLAPMFGALAAAAIAFVPGLAHAQGDYRAATGGTATYAPLAGATTLAAAATVTLPFDFSFFGQTASRQVTMSQFGYLSFAGVASDGSNDGIPHNNSFSTPTTFIAPWWDSMGTNGGGILRYQTLGAAPHRYTVFEWANVANCASPSANCPTSGARYSFEAILYETTNAIRFSYGPSPTTGSASVGLQKVLGTGIAPLSCTSASSGTCSTFVPNSTIDFYPPPDLSIASLSVDQTGYAGVALRESALIRNSGGDDLNTPIRYYLSTDTTISSGDVQLGETMARNFVAGTDTLVTSAFPIPAVTVPGAYFILSQVNPTGLGNESNTMNNVGPPTPITIGMPLADLVMTSISGPATSTPGGTVAITRTIANQGNAAAPTFKFTYFLSSNSVASLNDTGLPPTNTIPAGLVAGTPNTGTDMVVLPATLAGGQYWLGACVNYDTAMENVWPVPEISVVNNCTTASMPVLITSGALSVVTTSLPTATQYAPYAQPLIATGGAGGYTWAVKEGSTLPTWLTLSADGTLSANPQAAGTYTFEVQVSSGGMSASASLSLTVSPGNIPLVIPDQDLGTAVFASGYYAEAVASGGKPPYTWSVLTDRPPFGIAFAADGHFEGRATEVGDLTFTVQVTDSGMTSATRALHIRVVAPSTLHIATSKLDTAYLKKEYAQRLTAIGGKSPYTWTVEKMQQLPQNPTEQPGAVTMPMGGALPEGFGLAIDDGATDDFVRGVPTKAGLYALSMKVTDQNGAEDFTQLLLTISYDEPLAITTTALPDAFLGHEYAARLAQNGGVEATGVVFEVPCVKQATSVDVFVCAATDATQALPAGLVLNADGSISGTPTDSASADTVFSFLVKVSDDQNRQDVRSLSIRLRPDYGTAKSGGCSALGLEPSIGLLAGLFALRGAMKRRRAASKD